MTDDAHHMGLMAFGIEGVAHRLAVDGEALILARVDFVPAPQGAVQVGGLDADQHVKEGRDCICAAVSISLDSPGR